jgi:hypothetical protein
MPLLQDSEKSGNALGDHTSAGQQKKETHISPPDNKQLTQLQKLGHSNHVSRSKHAMSEHEPSQEVDSIQMKKILLTRPLPTDERHSLLLSFVHGKLSQCIHKARLATRTSRIHLYTWWIEDIRSGTMSFVAEKYLRFSPCPRAEGPHQKRKKKLLSNKNRTHDTLERKATQHFLHLYTFPPNTYPWLYKKGLYCAKAYYLATVTYISNRRTSLI